MKIITRGEKTEMTGTKDNNQTQLGIARILETLYQLYGYDFRQYSAAHIRRRIVNRMALSGCSDMSEVEARIRDDRVFASRLLQDLSITVTEMFRDPDFYRSLRENIIPVLKTYPFIKIWHAGCATGEEAYSMAILLHEEGLLSRTTLYATDFNQYALHRAKEGIFSNDLIKAYTANYQLAAGKESFSGYYTAHYGAAIMNQFLKQNIVFANHNMVTDGIFAEVHLVLCRNVLIYFGKELQDRVHRLFYDSLVPGGILCLGAKEGLKHTALHDGYTHMDGQQRIFKKKYL